MDKDIPYLSTKSLFGGVAKEFCQLFKYALCMSALLIHSNLFKTWILTESANITLCIGWMFCLSAS